MRPFLSDLAKLVVLMGLFPVGIAAMVSVPYWLGVVP